MITFIQLCYIIAASMFIVGLTYLSSPATARKGNLLASIGMLLAIIATLLDRNVLNYDMILVGIIIGSIIGAASAKMVKMTAMPQMVGLFNGFGGAASALVAVGTFLRFFRAGEAIAMDSNVSIILSVLIGGVTFTGSLLAFAKLQGMVSGSPITFPLQQAVNAGLLILFFLGGAYLLRSAHSPLVFFLVTLIALALGVLFVIPIGGADMPVVISLLNSFSGLAASAAGFVVSNNVLIVSGALVGASGLILTQVMCKAMNRSLSSVLFGAFGVGDMAVGAIEGAGAKPVRSIDAEEGAMMMAFARLVVIVPGYGMAAAQAQHAVRDLTSQLEHHGVEVKFAIHPVAGRMPGHMNVLLAEADVPYTQLYDMDDINPEFERADVALVIGANDVVNPAARHEKSSPIYGMPILNADKAHNVIVIKRSLNPGFAGIDNELFYGEKTVMLFGSARDKVSELVNDVKQL
ncbi:MAG: NAD(P)(+) transhydrogenase (Re/Si-specific) subunit beta [bacterium]|nr:NAD(P)(+) transhydrogenase (Re/Si-specific) subunit beta [bacterium]